MNLLAITTLLFFVISAICQGGSDIRLQEDQVTLKSSKYRVSVTATRLGERLAYLELRLGDVKTSIPKEELQRFEYPDLRSISINTHSSTGGDIPKELPKSYTIIGMKYGGTVEHGEKQHPLVVRPYVLFYFRNGKYTGWRIAEPQGEWANKWRIVEKTKGKLPEKGFIAKMVECPIIPQGAE